MGAGGRTPYGGRLMAWGGLDVALWLGRAETVYDLPAPSRRRSRPPPLLYRGRAGGAAPGPVPAQNSEEQRTPAIASRARGSSWAIRARDPLPPCRQAGGPVERSSRRMSLSREQALTGSGTGRRPAGGMVGLSGHARRGAGPRSMVPGRNRWNLPPTTGAGEPGRFRRCGD